MPELPNIRRVKPRTTAGAVIAAVLLGVASATVPAHAAGPQPGTPEYFQRDNQNMNDAYGRETGPGGQLFVSVPYGRREDHGWFRQPNRADLEALAASLGSEATVYRYRRAGWQPSSSRRAAHASYREMENPPAADFAAAARAVACIHGTRICSRCVPRR